MDVQNLKYNRELMKTKTRLEKELNMVNQEIKSQQENCSHIRVLIGQDNLGNFYNECLLCRFKQLPWRLQFPTIVAHKFKYEVYENGETEELRNGRMEEIRSLYLTYITENEQTEETLPEFTKHIERGTLC